MTTTVTAGGLVSRALKYLRVYGADESPTDDEKIDGFEELQAMLGLWSANPLTFSDDYPLPVFVGPVGDVEVHDALPDVLAYQLALRIAPEYGVEPSPEVYRRARGAMHAWNRVNYLARKAAATVQPSEVALISRRIYGVDC